MKLNVKSLIALLIFGVFGALYGLLTNIFFDDAISDLWTPLAIALFILIFSLLLGFLIIIISGKLGHKPERQTMIKNMALVISAVFVFSALFEFLYELGLHVEIAEPDSYILMIDDSGSMESNDGNNQREKAVSALVQDKEDTFKYSVYVFSDDAQKVRDMLPKSDEFTGIDLKSDGGTAMFACLKKVISDVQTGSLKTTSATRVILLSDGYATDEPLFTSKLLKEYVENNIVISTIGLGYGVDTDTMQHIAEYTGGVYIHIDDASMLDTAMIDAAIQTSTRTMFSFRGFCKTETLHAVLRVVFLLIIIGLIYVFKVYSYGRYYKVNMIISGILCVIAGFLPEIALQILSWNDDFVRVLFYILISITLLECVEPRQFKHEVQTYEEDESVTLSTANELVGEEYSQNENTCTLD